MDFSDRIYPSIAFAIFCIIFIYRFIRQEQETKEEADRADERAQRQHEQAMLDTALRGAVHDLARRKAGLDPLGFENTPQVAKFLSSAVPVPALPTTPAVPAAVLAASPQPQPIPVGEVLSEDAPLPSPEVAPLIPERILSVSIGYRVTGVIGFYAGESMVIRTIHVENPAEYGLPAADYSAGQFLLDGRSDEQLLADAATLLPGVFVRISSDPATEKALRIRAA